MATSIMKVVEMHNRVLDRTRNDLTKTIQARLQDDNVETKKESKRLKRLVFKIEILRICLKENADRLKSKKEYS